MSVKTDDREEKIMRLLLQEFFQLLNPIHACQIFFSIG